MSNQGHQRVKEGLELAGLALFMVLIQAPVIVAVLIYKGVVA